MSARNGGPATGCVLCGAGYCDEHEATAGHNEDRLAELAAKANRMGIDVSDLAVLRIRRSCDIDTTKRPERVLWRDAADANPEESVLSVGEAAIISGPGGVGKSTIASGLAALASTGGGAHCGIRIGDVRTTILSYEDAAYWLACRAGMGEARITTSRPSADPPPLFEAGETGAVQPTPAWDALRAHLIEDGTRLVVIDPIAAAVTNGHSAVGVARGVMLHLRELATEIGGAVLAIAHDTKGARAEVQAGQEVGPGAVAGSAAWHDAARTVLHLQRDRASGPGRFLLRCVKANYSPRGWAGNLRETSPWRGLEAVPGRECVTGDEIRERRAAAKPRADTSERDERIRSLSAEGMPQRDIAAAVGCSKTTVVRVLRRT